MKKNKTDKYTREISFCMCGTQLVNDDKNGGMKCPDCGSEVSKEEEITLTIIISKKGERIFLDFNENTVENKWVNSNNE